MEGQIRKLPDEVITQIAAGEVVERPASIVKELVENALDAEATEIMVSVVEGGIKGIRVQDNGVGMNDLDLQRCVLAHTTSKINVFEDLVNLNSFGFRGEALAAIAAVSKFTIASRQNHKPMGYALEVVYGTCGKIQSMGMSCGTLVTVENLFSTIPARQKFLKSAVTEFNHILEVVASMAILFPEKSFTLKHNGKVALSYPKSAQLSERLALVLGQNTAEKMITVGSESPYLTVTGVVSRPELSTSRADKQFLYVNGRRITDHYLSAAIKRAYGTLLMPRSYPLYALFINLPSEMVDINVHPRKSEVAFVNKGAVFQFLKQAVAKGLVQVDLTYGRYPSEPVASNFVRQTEVFALRRTPTISHPSLAAVAEAVKWQQPLISSVVKQTIAEEVWQLELCYLVTLSSQGLLIVDQHAAHERVLYEKLWREFNEQKKQGRSQKLLVPLELKLTVPQEEALTEQLTILAKIGFLFSETKPLHVVGVPVFLVGRDIYAIIHEVLDDILNDSPAEIDNQSLRILTYLSCRGAVKKGDYLSPEERQALLRELWQCESAYTCPHGRPVSIDLAIKDLEKMFKRVI